MCSRGLRRKLVLFVGAMLLSIIGVETSRAAVNGYDGQLLESGEVGFSIQMEVPLNPAFSSSMLVHWAPKFQWGLTKSLDLLIALGAEFEGYVIDGILDRLVPEPGLVVLRHGVVPGLSVGGGLSVPMKSSEWREGTMSLGFVFPAIFYTLDISETVSWTSNVMVDVKLLSGLSGQQAGPMAVAVTTSLEYAPTDTRSYCMELNVNAALSGSPEDVQLGLFFGAYGMGQDWEGLGFFLGLPLGPKDNGRHLPPGHLPGELESSGPMARAREIHRKRSQITPVSPDGTRAAPPCTTLSNCGLRAAVFGMSYGFGGKH